MNKTKWKNVQCHFSLCKLKEGHSRSLLTLRSIRTICKHLKAFRELYLANIHHALQKNVGDSDEGEKVYESIADNYCLPDNKVEVKQYTFLGTLYWMLLLSSQFLVVLLSSWSSFC